MKKNILKRVITGFPSGIAIGYIITIIISLTLGDGMFHSCAPILAAKYGNEINAVIIQTILSAVLGMTCAGASVIWEMDHWSIVKQTGLYFAIVSAAVMGVAYICEWMEHSVTGFICYFLIFFAIFVVAWMVQYFIWKHRISRLKPKIEDGNQ